MISLNFLVIEKSFLFDKKLLCILLFCWCTLVLRAQTVSLVKDIYPGILTSDIRGFSLMNDDAYFWARDTTGNNQIWRTNGYAAGTIQITELPGNFWPQVPVVVKDSLLIFVSSYGLETGAEPFYSDGTPGSGDILLDLNEGQGSIVQFGQGDGNYAYFMGRSTSWGRGFYRTDGTVAGTILLTNLSDNGLRHLLPFNGANFTRVFRGGDTWLLKTDGSVAGTAYLTRIDLDQSLTPTLNLGILNNYLHFLKEDDDENWGLWRTDGTVAGVEKIKDLNPTGGAKPYYLVSTGEQLFFAANDGVHGTEIWTSDGTAQGTIVLTDFNDTTNDQILPASFTPWGNEVLFVVRDSTYGSELWITDDTPAGAHLVKDIWLGPESANPKLRDAVQVDSLLFFPATTEKGKELWQTDGTEAGTLLVTDICPDECNSNPSSLFQLDEQRFLFKAFTLEHGIELWVYDHAGVTSVQEAAVVDSNDLLIYPNPSGKNQAIRLRWSENLTPATYQIINLEGEQMLTGNIVPAANSQELTLPPLSQGLYILYLSDTSGRVIAREKLVIH